MTRQISFMKSFVPSSCQNKKAFASVQLPYLFYWQLTVTLIIRSSDLRILATVSSLQTQLNLNCPLHLGKDTSSTTEAIADL